MIERKHELANCEECPLYEEGVFVPSSGPQKAKLVLVGEAPGVNETRTNEPFTGSSGQLLNQILNNVGIKREETFITNTCLCRPPDNATPSAKAIRSCKDRMVAEISAREPSVIVAMGNTASQTLLSSGVGITKLRVGPPKRNEELFGETPIIATFHPAAALYNPDSFPDIVTDFYKIGGANAADKDWTPPEYQVYDDIDRATKFLDELIRSDHRRVALDIEVGYDKDEEFIHPEHFRLLCIGFAFDPRKGHVLSESVCQSERVLSRVGKLLETKDIICQNGKYDMAGLYSLSPTGATNNLWFDTMLAHYATDERRGTHSLDQLAIEILGSPDWKKEVARYVGKDGSYADIPRDILYRYNAYDVVNTFRLVPELQRLMDEQNVSRVHEFLVRTSPTLMHMEMNGLAVDLDYNAKLMDEYLEVIEEQKTYMQEVLDNPTYNPNSWKQVKEAFFDHFKIRLKDTRADTIETIQERAASRSNMELYKFCTAHLLFKKESKSYGTYVKGIRKRIYHGAADRVPRVHASFLLHGTVTGRLSSRNPNLQNITRGSRLRRQFIPSSPDNRLIQVDYGQAELRVVCCLARDTYLRDVFSDSARDIHSEVAERFYGSDFTKEQRIRAKAVVFGLNYGREAFSLAAEHDMTVREAQTYINQFFEIIPDTVAFYNQVEEDILAGKDLETIFGRRRRFWLITDENKHKILKEGRSFIPQSTASDLTLEAANRFARQGFWHTLRIAIHDAIVLEVPQEEAEQVGHELEKVMQETAAEIFDDYIPFTTDLSIGESWGEL